MGILDDIRDDQDRTHPCVFARVAADLSDEDQTDLETALRDPTVTTAAIRRVLRARGYPMGYVSVSRHRKAECCCG